MCDLQSTRLNADVQWPIHKDVYATYRMTRTALCCNMCETRGGLTSPSMTHEPTLTLADRPITKLDDNVSQMTPSYLPAAQLGKEQSGRSMTLVRPKGRKTAKHSYNWNARSSCNLTKNDVNHPSMMKLSRMKKRFSFLQAQVYKYLKLHRHLRMRDWLQCNNATQPRKLAGPSAMTLNYKHTRPVADGLSWPITINLNVFTKTFWWR